MNKVRAAARSRAYRAVKCDKGGLGIREFAGNESRVQQQREENSPARLKTPSFGEAFYSRTFKYAPRKYLERRINPHGERFK